MPRTQHTVLDTPLFVERGTNNNPAMLDEMRKKNIERFGHFARLAHWMDYFSLPKLSSSLLSIAWFMLLSEHSPLFTSYGLGASPTKMMNITQPQPPSAIPDLPQSVLDNLNEINQILPFAHLPPVELDKIGVPNAYIDNVAQGQEVTSAIWAYATTKVTTTMMISLLAGASAGFYTRCRRQHHQDHLDNNKPAAFLFALSYLTSYSSISYITWATLSALNQSAPNYLANEKNITDWVNLNLQSANQTCGYTFIQNHPFEFYSLWPDSNCDAVALQLMLSASIIPYTAGTLAYFSSSLLTEGVTGCINLLAQCCLRIPKIKRSLNNIATQALLIFNRIAPTEAQFSNPLTHLLYLISQNNTQLSSRSHAEKSCPTRFCLRLAHMLKSGAITLLAGAPVICSANLAFLLLRTFPDSSLSECDTYTQAISKDQCSGTVYASEGSASIQLYSAPSTFDTCNKSLSAHNIDGMELPPFDLYLPCHHLQNKFMQPMTVIYNEVGPIYAVDYYASASFFAMGLFLGFLSILDNNQSSCSRFFNKAFAAVSLALGIEYLPIIAGYIALLFKNIPPASRLTSDVTDGLTFLPQYLLSLGKTIITPEQQLYKQNITNTTQSPSESVDILTQSLTQLLTWTDMIYALCSLLVILPLTMHALSYFGRPTSSETPTNLHNPLLDDFTDQDSLFQQTTKSIHLDEEKDDPFVKSKSQSITYTEQSLFATERKFHPQSAPTHINNPVLRDHFVALDMKENTPLINGRLPLPNSI